MARKITGLLNDFSKKAWKIMLNAGNLTRVLKIQQRLIISFLVLSLVPLILMGITSYSKSNQAISSRISRYSSELMKQTTKNLESELQRYEQIARDLGYQDTVQTGFLDMKKQSDDEKFITVSTIFRFLREKTASYNDIIEIAIATGGAEDEQLLANAKAISSEDIGRIRETAKASKGAPGWLLIKGTDNKDRLVTVRELNLTKGSGKLGVIFITLDAAHFSEIFSDMNLGEGTEMFMADLNGLVLSSNTGKVPVNAQYSDTGLVKKLKAAMESDKSTFNYNKSLATFAYIESNSWYVVALIPYSYINAGSRSILSSVIWLFIACLIFSTILSFIVSSSISTNLRRLVSAMKEARSGNLAIRLEDAGNDEIGIVNRNFNDMLANIRSLVSKVRGSSINLIESLEQIQTSAATSHSTSEQIAITMHEIAKGTNEQAQQVSRGVECTNTLSEGINKVGGNVANVSRFISETKDLSGQGLSVVQMLKDKASEANLITDKVAIDVNGLNEDMKQIIKIVNAIAAIAEQTNLLALNATIEAARAGEAGKGFSVVATEVKKLADKSKESSVMINNIINNIRIKTDETVATANSGSTVVKEQMQAVGMTDDAFKNIYTAMENIIGQMANMHESVENMLASKDDTIRVMENISAVSQEAAATTQEVSASTHEQISGSEELSRLAEKLNGMAQELSDSISIFKVE